MEGHQSKAEERFDPAAVPPPSGTGVTPPVAQPQPQVPAHKVVELEAAAAFELDAVVAKKQVSQLRIKVAMHEIEAARKDEVRYERQEAILVARAAAAAGIEKFKGARVIGQAKIAFIL